MNTSPNLERTPVNSHSSAVVITYQKVVELRSNPRNSRTHSKRQIRQIADSIKAFGLTNPVLLDRNNTIIAGHSRVRAAQLLGLSEVPTIRLENLSGDQVRAYVIADNRLAEKAGWDKRVFPYQLLQSFGLIQLQPAVFLPPAVQTCGDPEPHRLPARPFQSVLPSRCDSKRLDHRRKGISGSAEVQRTAISALCRYCDSGGSGGTESSLSTGARRRGHRHSHL